MLRQGVERWRRTGWSRSDGVIAVIITIMVLELKAPHDVGLGALKEAAPVFLSYYGFLRRTITAPGILEAV